VQDQKVEEVVLEDETKWMEIGERSFGKLLRSWMVWEDRRE